MVLCDLQVSLLFLTGYHTKRKRMLNIRKCASEGYGVKRKSAMQVLATLYLSSNPGG